MESTQQFCVLFVLCVCTFGLAYGRIGFAGNNDMSATAMLTDLPLPTIPEMDIKCREACQQKVRHTQSITIFVSLHENIYVFFFEFCCAKFRLCLCVVAMNFDVQIVCFKEILSQIDANKLEIVFRQFARQRVSEREKDPFPFARPSVQRLMTEIIVDMHTLCVREFRFAKRCSYKLIIHCRWPVHLFSVENALCECKNLIS